MRGIKGRQHQPLLGQHCDLSQESHQAFKEDYFSVHCFQGQGGQGFLLFNFPDVTYFYETMIFFFLYVLE